MDNAQVLYRSTNPNLLVPTGMLRRKFPLPIDSPIRLSAYAFDAAFSGLLDAGQNNGGGVTSIFPQIALNTPASNASFNMPAGSTLLDSNAILTNYSQPSDTGAGIGSFTTTFTRVPASWDEFVTQEWTPPGWIGPAAGAAGATYTARDTFSREATVRQHYDYFVVDPNVLLPAGIQDSGGTAIIASAGTDSLLNGNTSAKNVTSSSAIPLLFKTYFCNTLFNSGTPPTPIYSSHTNSITPSGGILGYCETFPTIGTYQTWLGNVATLQAAGGNPWTGLVWNGKDLTQAQGSITQIILKDSFLKPYAGNIFERVTTYALIV